jgi:predicted NAD-dependent protein-ADP-ribosyltransferase YbiA (DUF1768 family)
MPLRQLTDINGHKIVAFDDPKDPWGILSNSAPTPIKIKTMFGMETFPSVEHYIQYLKTPGDQIQMRKIQLEPNITKVQEMGAKFTAGLSKEAATKTAAAWEKILETKLSEAIDAKLASHKEFATALEDTETAFLVADTSQRTDHLQDGNLGWKSNHKSNIKTIGNRLGILLMDKRDAINQKKGNYENIVGHTTQLTQTIQNYLQKNYPKESITAMLKNHPQLSHTKKVTVSPPPVPVPAAAKPPTQPAPKAKTKKIIKKAETKPEKPKKSHFQNAQSKWKSKLDPFAPRTKPKLLESKEDEAVKPTPKAATSKSPAATAKPINATGKSASIFSKKTPSNSATTTSSPPPTVTSTVVPRGSDKTIILNSSDNIKKILRALNQEQKEQEWRQKPSDPASKDVVIGDKDNHNFTVQKSLLLTTDETLETFKAMLIGFQAVHPKNRPRITITEPRLEQIWKDACAATNVNAEIVHAPKPAPTTEPEQPAPSSRRSP